MKLKLDVDLESLADQDLVQLINDCSKELGSRLTKALNSYDSIRKPLKEDKQKSKAEHKREYITQAEKEYIKECITKNPGATANEILEILNKNGKNYKLQAVYYQMSSMKNKTSETKPQPKTRKCWKDNPLAKKDTIGA